MESSKHKTMAERIMRTMEKLGDDDWEMTIEGAMLATTHWVNYALHESATTTVEDDVMHGYFLTGNQWQKYSIYAGEILNALDEIEKCRPMYVRGDVAGGPRIAGRARILLERSMQIALGFGNRSDPVFIKGS